MILETAVNTTRQSRNRTQTSFNAEGAEQRGGEEHFLSPFPAFLSESLRLCVKSSPPASKSGYSGAMVQRRNRTARSVWSAWSLLPSSNPPRHRSAPASCAHLKRFARCHERQQGILH